MDDRTPARSRSSVEIDIDKDFVSVFLRMLSPMLELLEI